MKSKIFTSSAPAPIGPYSQAIRAGNWIFVSGQIPLDPVSGKLELHDIEHAANLVMQHIKNILNAAGAGMENIVKTTIFLKNMDDFTRVNEIYAGYFENTVPPARETVEVARLPKDVPLEISVVAWVEEK